MKYLYTILVVVLLGSVWGCTKEYSTRISGVVFDVKTEKPISGAKVVVNGAEPVYSDAEGEFFIDDYPLGKYIVDSITFNVRANSDYYPKVMSTIIGNRQKDIFPIPMIPKGQLQYTPSGALNIPAQSSSSLIKISNTGVDTVTCSLSASCNWVSFGSNSINVPPAGITNLNVQVLTNGLNCRDSCILFLEWGDNFKDSILIIKEIPDTEKPFVNFTASDYSPLQYDLINFDASPSTDNCSNILLYSWSFDNGNNWSPWTAEPQTSYAFLNTGQITVSVRVRDEQANESIFSQSVNVQIAPTQPILNPQISINSSGTLLSVTASANLISAGQTFSGLVDHGFVWSSSIQNPELGQTPGGGELHMNAFNATSGTFIAVLDNLQPRKYYFRAFAVNGLGTAVYSAPFEFEVELLEYVTISQGTSQVSFVMGDNNAAQADAKPQHTVVLDPFRISKTEVTNAQYVSFLNISGVSFTELENYIEINDPNCGIEIFGGGFRAKSGRENFPVVLVSWEGAVEFCTFAQGRLPTEAEWECAAKSAKSASPYFLYSGSNTLDSYGWYASNSIELKEVKQRTPNQIDLFDMSGNAREWCSDLYSANFYTPGIITNPTGPSTGSERVVRGGSFALSELQARVVTRDRKFPTIKQNDIGFRCVKY